MSWTDTADLKAQVLKLWDKGRLLAASTDGATCGLFPLRLRLVTPGAAELADRFDTVRRWATALRQGCQPCRLQERELRHRAVGNHSLPETAWIDTLADAVTFIGKTPELRRFQGVLRATEAAQPRLLPWLGKRPLVALTLADVWPQFLTVVAWFQVHPRPGVYLRQVDVAGVDTKFLETHRAVLAELLDLCLPDHHIDATATGVSQFCRRYGLQDKPLRVRFRWLGEEGGTDVSGPLGSDLTVTQTAFERLNLPVQRVFITENEVNFLAFPMAPGRLIVFGAGYGFDALAAVRWLHGCDVHHWGDIDTHGFAILDQLRVHVPHAQSLLMDEATFLTHKPHWGHEPQPVQRELPRLTETEASLYRALHSNQWGAGLRLEQERVGFGWVQRALACLEEASITGVEGRDA